MKYTKVIIVTLFCIGFVLGSVSLAFGQPSEPIQNRSSPKPTVTRPVAFSVSPPFRDLAKLPPHPLQAHYESEESNPGRRLDFGPYVVDPVEQRSFYSSVPAAIRVNVLGLGWFFPGSGGSGYPSDVNLAVGDTQIVQWVNGGLEVFDKTGNPLLPRPLSGNELWKTLGGVCYDNNDGDAIAQWDKTAHRWLLAQPVFHSPSGYYTCVAVSTSPDAAGTYYQYQYEMKGDLPDYPKWGVWPTGYFQTRTPALLLLMSVPTTAPSCWSATRQPNRSACNCRLAITACCPPMWIRPRHRQPGRTSFSSAV